MRFHRRAAVAAVSVACAAAAVVASPAAGRTYELSGTQIPVDPDNGLYLMHGDLLGVWRGTSFTQDPTVLPPLVHGTGTEEFYGCLNLNRDGFCFNEPIGTLKFTFDFWGKTSADGSELWGPCTHPIVSGDRGFAGADGIITMIDNTTPRGLHTRWQGVVILPDSARAAARLAQANRHRIRPRSMLRQLRHRHAVTAAIPNGFCGGL